MLHHSGPYDLIKKNPSLVSVDTLSDYFSTYHGGLKSLFPLEKISTHQLTSLSKPTQEDFECGRSLSIYVNVNDVKSAENVNLQSYKWSGSTVGSHNDLVKDLNRVNREYDEKKSNI